MPTRILRIVRFAPLSLLLVAAAARAENTAQPPAEVKAAFLKLLDRPRVPLDPQFIGSAAIARRTVRSNVSPSWCSDLRNQTAVIPQ